MTYQLTLDTELIVDGFCGGGGVSTGIEQALGRPVNIGMNHDEEAIGMHEANHPLTRHLCENIFAIDPVKECRGRRVLLAWFSPDCTHHSAAKGGKPRKRHLRSLAWVVVRWARTVRPRIIMVENVREFQGWGPLSAEGMPDKDRKGQTFNFWIEQLKRLGYRCEWREVRACDYGDPTIRKRLIMIFRCDGLPIVWPKATHGTPGSGLKPYRTAAECIDWSLPCPSIFTRKKPLAENTMDRIAKGIRRYVLDNPNPFIVPIGYGEAPGQQPRTHDINEPLPTIVGSRKHALVMPYLTEHANASTQRTFPIDEPLRTQCANVKGGHFALCAAFLAKHFGGVVGCPVQQPLPTILTKAAQTNIVTAHIMKMRGNPHERDAAGHRMDEPLHTISAGGTHHAQVQAFLIKYFGTDQDPRLDEPMHTVTSKHRFGLVNVHGTPYQIVDIGMRMLVPRELYRAQGFPESYIIDRRANGKPITITGQVSMCGNSVPPGLVKAHIRANVPRAAIFADGAVA